LTAGETLFSGVSPQEPPKIFSAGKKGATLTPRAYIPRVEGTFFNPLCPPQIKFWGKKPRAK